MVHLSVLQKEAIRYLDVGPNENFIDCTVDGGGHASEILRNNGPRGKVLGLDADLEILKETKNLFEKKEYRNRVVLLSENFNNLKEAVSKSKFKKVKGILLDLGMSSWHLEKSGRGFSFLKTEPLDMRYNPKNPLTAEKILNFWSESEISRILRDFGEERFAGSIAREIVRERKVRPVKSTSQLVKVIQRAVPGKYQYQKSHFATRTFQALRIAVNQELENLTKVLPQTIEVLEHGGRVVVISFHSLEDRIVKNFLKEKNRENSINILTKKPIGPSQEEIRINPRSRSARLRAAEKI